MLFILSLIAPAALAQTFNRWEVYGGWSQARQRSNIRQFSFSDPGGDTTVVSDLCSAATGEMLGPNSQQFFCRRSNFSGFDLGLTWNVHRWLGITADVTRHARKRTFIDDFGGITQTIGTDESLLNVLAGVQVKDNATGARVKPFAHALAGVARYTDRQSQDLDALPQFDYLARDRETSLALKIGGGIDVAVTPRVDLRVIQLDYNPVYARNRSYGSISGPFTFDVKGRTAQNWIVGFGVVVH
jgi:opacity protein-like surface antigen